MDLAVLSIESMKYSTVHMRPRLHDILNVTHAHIHCIALPSHCHHWLKILLIMALRIYVMSIPFYRNSGQHATS